MFQLNRTKIVPGRDTAKTPFHAGASGFFGFERAAACLIIVQNLRF
jgi:hypothetical protein